MLLLGGSQIHGSGNRLFEDASELEVCLDKDINNSLLSAIASEDRYTIVEVLTKLGEQDINLLGSRGYVYSTCKLAKELIDERAEFKTNVFPRTAGLRQAIINSFNKGDK